MTTVVDILNRALQMLGTRTTVSAAELAAQSSNEAIQGNIAILNTRDDLLRMAPWDCAVTTDILRLVAARPGTPENPGIDPGYWMPGQPLPPWLYEYAYPADCLRAVQIENYSSPYRSGGSFDASFDSSTDDGDSYPQPPSNPGLPPTLGDFSSTDFSSDFNIGSPGIPASPGGPPSIFPYSSSYTGPSCGPIRFKVAIDKSQLTALTKDAKGNFIPSSPFDQQVILTNQPGAVLTYVRQITDPNLMDTLFTSAWSALLAAQLAMALTGDKQVSALLTKQANQVVMLARSVDGNEGYDVYDSTPDWIATRGGGCCAPALANSFNWGPLWPTP